MLCGNVAVLQRSWVNYGLLALEPIESSGECENAHETSGGFRIARRDGLDLRRPKAPNRTALSEVFSVGLAVS